MIPTLHLFALFHYSLPLLASPWLIPYSKAAPPSFIDLSESLAACQIQTESGREGDLKEGAEGVDLLHADI